MTKNSADFTIQCHISCAWSFFRFCQKSTAALFSQQCLSHGEPSRPSILLPHILYFKAFHTLARPCHMLGKIQCSKAIRPNWARTCRCGRTLPQTCNVSGLVSVWLRLTSTGPSTMSFLTERMQAGALMLSSDSPWRGALEPSGRRSPSFCQTETRSGIFLDTILSSSLEGN